MDFVVAPAPVGRRRARTTASFVWMAAASAAPPRNLCWKCEGTGIHRHRKRQQNPAGYDARHPAGPPPCTVCAGGGHLGRQRQAGSQGQVSVDGITAEEVLALARDGDLQKLQLLPSGTVATAADRHCSAALHWSAGNGHLTVCKWLVHERGSDVTTANRTGRTPLHLAARNGHLDICRWLVEECSVPADVPAKHGVTALQLATWQNQAHICHWLVDTCGVNVFEVNEFGCTAVHWLGMSAGVDADSEHALPRWFLQRGLDFRLRNEQGHTALHKAAFSGHGEFCRWLVETVGLLDSQADESGNYAADHAEMGEHPKLAVWLRQEASAERRRASALLRLPPDADIDQIRSSYRALARHCHPDKQKSQRNAVIGNLSNTYADKEDGDSATESAASTASTGADQISWHQLQQAYEILSQPATGFPGQSGETRTTTGSQRNAAHDLRLMLRMVAEEDGAVDMCEADTDQAVMNFSSKDVGQRSQAKRQKATASGVIMQHQPPPPPPRQQQQQQQQHAENSAAKKDQGTVLTSKDEGNLHGEGTEGWSEQSLFKARLAAVLLEYHEGGIPLANLPKKYRQVWGVDLPPAQAFRRRKMVQVLRSMPDVVRVQQTHANHTILHCVKTREDLKLAIEDDTRSRNAESD